MRSPPPFLLAALSATALVGVAGAVLWSPTAVGVFNDDGVYVLLGKAIAQGEGLRYMGVAAEPPAPKFPPLYPILLAAVWAIWPSFPANVFAFKALNLLLAAVGAGLFAAYVARAFGVAWHWGAAAALAAFLTVDTWRYAVVPLSEPLFLCTFVLALAAAAQVERQEQAGMPALALALAAMAAALYTRTIGVVLVPALVAGWALAGRRRAAAAAAAAGVIAVVPWFLWTRAASAEIPAPMAEILGPYGGWIAAEVGGAGAGYTAVLARRAADLAGRMFTVLLPGPPAPRAGFAPVVAAAGLAGTVWMWRSARSTVIAVAGFLMVLWLWPYSARRLVAPAVPWLVLAVGAGFLAGARAGRPRLGAVARVAGVIWGVWFVGGNVFGLTARRHDAVLLERSLLLMRAAEAVSTATPADAVVGAPELWAGLHLYTGRTVAPSARFRPLSARGPAWGTTEEQIELWRAAQVDYLVLEFGGRIHGEALLALQQRCGAESVTHVARFPGGELVRVALRGCGA